MRGAVEFFDRHSGFGQIVGDDHRIYRTHRKELVGGLELTTGQRVGFVPETTSHGLRAREVRPCEASAAPARSSP